VERVTLRELAVATRTADALVYTVGIAGVIAGGLLLRGGSTGFALVAFVLTFVAGAALRLLSAITRGIADIKRGLENQQNPPSPLPPPADPDAPPDPYRRWGGWH
jgi:1,4-dihydroxy-2-naphthoate octaprenyltransferase